MLKIIIELLKTINPENADVNNVSDWEHREAARAVVFDNENRIGLLHVRKENYYKLPGGGVEKGESLKVALDRELKEELGIEIKVVKEIGSIIEFRASWKLQQTSYCFLAKINSEKKEPNFTAGEISVGFETVWVSPTESLKLLNLKLTQDYEGKFIEERDFFFFSAALNKIE